jgi:hypothetical protein
MIFSSSVIFRFLPWQARIAPQRPQSHAIRAAMNWEALDIAYGYSRHPCLERANKDRDYPLATAPYPLMLSTNPSRPKPTYW